MRIAHLADLHLGYSAYGRTNEQGLNQREADVVRACEDAFARIATLQPDLVLIAGDVFHKVRPTNAIINKAFKEFRKLRAQVKAPIVMIAGNHEAPRSIESGCILRLFTNIEDIHIADARELSLGFDDLRTMVTCLPYTALPRLDTLNLAPDPAYKYNVLVLHGTVEGVMKGDFDPLTIRREELDKGWDYIAAGHYHSFTKLAPNAYYAGSPERTSTNIWAEAREEKGFVEYDLEARKVTFHPLTTRPVVDLAPIDAAGLSDGEQLNSMLASHVDGVPGGLDGKIVRQLVLNFPRSMRKQLDFARVRVYRAQSLYFNLVLRSPRQEELARAESGEHKIGSLRQEVEDYLNRVPVEKGLERDLLVAKGLRYLDNVLHPELQVPAAQPQPQVAPA